MCATATVRVLLQHKYDHSPYQSKRTGTAAMKKAVKTAAIPVPEFIRICSATEFPELGDAGRVGALVGDPATVCVTVNVLLAEVRVVEVLGLDGVDALSNDGEGSVPAVVGVGWGGGLLVAGGKPPPVVDQSPLTQVSPFKQQPPHWSQ